MRNIAKTFFLSNNEKYVCLVQYLHQEGESSEHYHEEEEFISQIVGRSFIELRPVEDDTERTIVEMHPGKVYRIPPRMLHSVHTQDQASVTMPIKMLVKGRTDRFTQDKSELRIANEVKELMNLHYNSGNEAVGNLHYYMLGLSQKEQQLFDTILRRNIQNEHNPNRKNILHGIMSYARPQE